MFTKRHFRLSVRRDYAKVLSLLLHSQWQKFIKRFDDLQKQSQRQIIILGAALIVMIGSIDYITGPELSFSVFYLIPIAMIAWLRGEPRLSIAAAFGGASVWLIVDLIGDQNYSSNLIPFWNAGVRLSFFLIVALIISFLRTATIRREELIQFVVHDLRSPLANTLTGLQYLFDVSNNELNSTQQELVQLSITSCERMMTLVNSLLDVAKLESGQLKLNMRPTDVQESFDGALRQVKTMAMHIDVKIVSQVEMDAESVLADPELLERVLINLISNALKYSPQGTTVFMQAILHKRDMVAIHIRDQGGGIPAEWIDKVFSKFAQVEARKEGIAVGSGLGLTFCQLAIQAQRGQIWISSIEGQGTTVSFTLPRSCVE